jgi:hypothetical protein
MGDKEKEQLIDALIYILNMQKEKCTDCTYGCTLLMGVCVVMRYRLLLESVTGKDIDEILK